MPLSEGEQRRLDEIERALRNEDPNFAATITISRVKRHRALVAALVFMVGMVGLVVGLVTTDASLWAGIVISVLGAAAMATGAVLYFRPAAASAADPFGLRRRATHRAS